MTDTDSLGLWISLGVLQLRPDSWLKFQRQATWGNKTFRIIFTSPEVPTSTYCWIRQHFPSTGDVTPALRYFPKEEPQIIELPIPPELADRNNSLIRDIEVKQNWPRRFGVTVPTPLFTIRLEELAGY